MIVGHEDDIEHPYNEVDGMGWCDANLEGMRGVNNADGVQGVKGAPDLEEHVEVSSDSEDSALNFRFNDSDDEEGDEGYFEIHGVDTEKRVEAEQNVESKKGVEIEENGKKRKNTIGEASSSAKRKRGRPRKNRAVHNKVSHDPRTFNFDEQRELENDSIHLVLMKNAKGKATTVSVSHGGCLKGKASQNAKGKVVASFDGGNASHDAKGKAITIPHDTKGKANNVAAKSPPKLLPKLRYYHFCIVCSTSLCSGSIYP
ncbi:hypothetical protein RIF29_15618 [Crotalaria pallida]|uniref:Uncharacterized protein n=1 Tax=Crotalaria pallida TaxID=3830 RepID=A0AAN9IET5_CROPI